MRDALLRDQEGAARVDLVHQVIALHRCGERAGEADGAGVVHQNVDATELRDRLGNGLLDALLVADIAGEGQGLAAGFLDFLGCREDRAGQARIGLHGLRRDCNVGTVTRSTQRDGESDTPAAAGYEQGLVTQTHGAPKKSLGSIAGPS
jgi:hypothetical protein